MGKKTCFLLGYAYADDAEWCRAASFVGIRHKAKSVSLPCAITDAVLTFQNRC